ncbi:expressed unknown protein [Seminavis robusta]|uniref:Uncharacterized protein n=1 Tax=Seminavis robusta TaxID=568900 RepID=A0A9N8DGR0_9STRA|nr:expressed unknown protein [Seminavis robusta]|eukprot:Sro136_g064260.1 n/a (237) ;mRNA; f:100976-101686
MQWIAKKVLESFTHYKKHKQKIPLSTAPSNRRNITASRKHTKKFVSQKRGFESRTDTADFRIPNLHRTQAVAVWDLRNHKDAYTGFLHYEMDSSQMDLDHVLELHVVRDAFDRVRPTGLHNKTSLKSHLSTLLNQPTNLNFTTSEINQIKFRGVYRFQREYCSPGPVKTEVEAGLVHYLKAANYRSQRLSRKTTARIQDEIVRSYDAVSDGLYEEDPLQRNVLDLLHHNLTAMRLF